MDWTVRQPPPAFASMRIGLLGGSFNPAHDGHRHISLTAIQRLGLHHVWWLVTPGNPLKDTGELAALPDRIDAARRIAAHPRIRVTAFEVDRPSPYAYDTVRFLTRRYPGVRFVWIMGGDNLAQLHEWRRWRDLVMTIPMLVVDRPGARYRALESPAAQLFAYARLPEDHVAMLPDRAPPAWCYMSLPLSDQSSTAIRREKREKDFRQQ